MPRLLIAICLFIDLLPACRPAPGKQVQVIAKPQTPLLKNIPDPDTTIKSIHVFVALCDNKYQGIIPVPPKIGNGQDADLNLYWGGDYGVRTYFKRSKEWHLVKTIKAKGIVLQRLVFKHATASWYLVADAYNGQYIKQTTIDFLYSCAGKLNDTLHIGHQIIGTFGNARLLAYIGHDGLMDFKLTPAFADSLAAGPAPPNAIRKPHDCIVLACISKKYFKHYIAAAKAYPLLWTTGLMCPEAYTLHDALVAYIKHEPKDKIRLKAAKAYDKYQKSGLTFAQGLLVEGW